MDPLHKISYGLYVLTARENGKDNGCIINTLVQITSKEPMTVSISVNKQNLTHDMIQNTGLFNVSMLTTSAPLKLIQHFGYRSGKTFDKFANFSDLGKGDNGVVYITEYTNAFISCKIKEHVDCSTHTLFIAEVTQAKSVSDEESVTYAYYQKNIKPTIPNKKDGFRCRICNYLHEGDTLPIDIICPVCKHGASDFERVQIQREETVMENYVCTICAYVYDAAAEGVKWEDIPADYTCPVCGVGKELFEKE